MVAPVDTFVYFTHHELYSHFRALFEKRSSSGRGRVLTGLAEGEIGAAVTTARRRVGAAPLGLVTSSQSEALQALAAGADEAEVFTSDDVERIVLFLDRLRVRAGIRRASERHQSDFVQAAKLAALGTLIAGVGHELNNPLSTITLGLDVLRSGLATDFEQLWQVKARLATGAQLSAQDVAAVVRKLQGDTLDVESLLSDLTLATETVSQLVQDLRVFSRSNQDDESSFFSAAEVIEQSIRLVRREFGANTIVEQDYEDRLPALYLPRNRLAQVLTNLLVNAAHAIREVERDVHHVRVGARVDEQHIAISITDTGSGIAEDALERIFDPFFTTKREGDGTGLGLSISRSIVQQMGGDLSVSSVYGDGATFLCFLPLPTPNQVRQGTPSTRPSFASVEVGGVQSVLVIDDDDKVLRATARAIRDRYRVLTARHGLEANELISSGAHVDVVVMELDLPELDGLDFYNWLREYHPALSKRVVVVTGAQERGRYSDFLKDSTLKVLHKPIGADALLDAIASVRHR